MNNNEQMVSPVGEVGSNAIDNKNARTHLIMGVVTGAAIAYLVSNQNVRKSLFFTGQKAWSTIRGEVEELKERLEDTQAELEYFRNLHKGD